MTLAEHSSIRGEAQRQAVAPALLAWYDRHHRELPWRIAPSRLAAGDRPDPYRVWLSEIMLQQTTVEAVKPYFARFAEKWPSVAALAAADVDDVMKAWAGLGYYSRARNLKKCAELVVERHGGVFPRTEEALRALPGIGPYTAAAIAAIAFDEPAAVVDGNVERVVSRLNAIATPLPDAKKRIGEIVRDMVPGDRPGCFAQAMMDLGATICTPKRPKCIICPVQVHCVAVRTGDPAYFPVRAPKPDKPQRYGAAFVALRADGAILLRKRPARGLLGGMAEVPTSQWTARLDGVRDESAAPFPGIWTRAGTVRHVFTHFALELTVFQAEISHEAAPDGAWWSSPDAIHGEALPTVMKKVVEAAVPGATKRPLIRTANS